MTERRKRMRRTVSLKQLRQAQERLRVLGQDQVEPYERPSTRKECPEQRPCPFVGCRHNLHLDAMDSGSIKFNYPGQEVGAIKGNCVLDLADAGTMTLEQVGLLLGITRERVRQIEIRALEKLYDAAREAGISKQDAQVTRGPTMAERWEMENV